MTGIQDNLFLFCDVVSQNKYMSRIICSCVFGLKTLKVSLVSLH